METSANFILIKFCSVSQPFWFHQGHLISNPVFSADSLMKRLLYSVCLFVITLACESDIFPTDLLYQRWRLERTRQGSGPWTVISPASLSDTEYRLDGTLVYRYDGKIGGYCCRPSHFKRQKNELTFTSEIPCPLYVFCAGTDLDGVTITQLTDDLLELTTDETVSQYRSVK